MAFSSFQNVNSWIDQNKQFFVPPVCNKLMHEGQLNIMFVGGPNRRNDFHIENGEELFFQLKGDMLLKVVEKNKHRDVIIKEGEVFLLPRAIPHSPQRFADTIGLVVERSRLKDETDGLRYYVYENGMPTTATLFEQWFQWDENRHIMSEFLEKFYSTEQYKTGKPIPGSIPDTSPTEVDSEKTLDSPFSLFDWIANNRHEIDSKGKLNLYDADSNQLQVYIFGRGDNTDCLPDAETWIWQLEGDSNVTFGSSEYNLKKDDSVLVPAGRRFHVKQEQGSLALVCSQVFYHPNESGQHVTPGHS